MNPGRHAAPSWTIRLLGPCVIAAATVLLPSSEAGATTFQPSWNASIADPTLGASSALTFDLNLSSPHSQFSTLISFIPPQFGVTSGDGITNGAISGHINAVAKIGLINGACDSNVVVGFDLMDASTDPEETIYLYDGVYDYDGDTLPENVDRYPSTLAVLAPDLVPIQRLYGQIPVAGILVPLNLIIFAPGTPVPGLPALDPSLGYPTATLLGDPFAVPYPGDSITDYCTPLTATVILGGVTQDHTGTPANEAGQVLRTNPPQSGAFNSVIFARSQWDADNDGIENTLDPCPLTPDLAWNPRSNLSSSGDADLDGLPDSCDTNDSQSKADQDADGFFNRQDLCPLLIPSYYLHFDEDRDGIGDECDPFPEDRTNSGGAHRHDVCVSDTINIGSGMPGPPAWSCPSGPDLPIPPRLILHPDEGTEIVDFVHSLHVHTYRIGATGPAVAYTVSFEVTGANTVAGSCLTDNYGECSFNYQGLNPGLDTITASVTIDGYDLTDTVTNNFFGVPANNDFGAAMTIASLPFTDTQTPIAADNEFGEPKPCGGFLNGSTWYSFAPATDVLVTAEVETNGGPMMLAAHKGTSLADLTLVQCDATYPDPFAGPLGAPPPEEEYALAEYVAFKASAEVTYFIQVGSQFGFYGDPDVVFSLQESMLGDANCSADVNSVDALAVLRKSAGLAASPCVANGDVDCNGVINAVDALLILRASAGLIPKPTSCPV